MRKNLFTIGLLATSLSVSAQILCHADKDALFYVSEGALVYNGGGLQAKDNAVYDIHGNVMVVGTSADVIKTIDAAGIPKTITNAGGNIILRLDDKTSYSKYGQLYITGIPQANITGFVDKEYLDYDQGAYQQIALPFYKKPLSSLSDDFRVTFTANRWTQTEVLNYDNISAVSDNLPLWISTTLDGSINNNLGSSVSTKNTSYYMLGAKAFNANTPPAGKTTFVIKGMPYADVISETLVNAGAGLNYGAGGTALNAYREKYNSYLSDVWSVPAGVWTGNYGKNIYQFGNPFLTNLDLSLITAGYETATNTDGNNIPNITGIRYSSSNWVWDSVLGSYVTAPNLYTTFANGVPVGDPIPVIKPMGTFVIKMSDNTSQTLLFDKLRRFKYTNRDKAVNYDVTAAKMTSSTTSSMTRMASSKAVSTAKTTFSGNTVKQLGVIALDANGSEIGRTYYVVYPNAVSGQPTIETTQVAANSSNVIGTFEENINGGVDVSLKDTYWLYINEANETGFKGKEVPLKVYSDNVKSLKFEVKENAENISGATLSSGESFYIQESDGKIATIAQGATLPVSTKDLGLYYGSPTGVNAGTLASSEAVVKPSESVVVMDESLNKHVILFDKTWKTADVAVYDMSGKLVVSANKVNANNNFVINLPEKQKGIYVVTAISESGHKFVQKIKK